MTVLTSDVGEGDFELHRYGDNRIGVHWEENLGGYYAPKDLTTWACVLYLEDAFGDVFYQSSCTVTTTGDTWADIPASVFPADTPDHQKRGKWRIVGKQGSKTELVGHGDFRVS